MPSRSPLPLAALLAALSSCRSVEEPVLPPAWGAAEASRPLTHEDCVGLALRSAPTAAAWRARLQAASAALTQTRALPNPELELSWEDLDVFSATERALQQTYGLAYALDELALRRGGRAPAEHELAAEEAELRAEGLRLAAEVRGAYDDLTAARARAALARELAELAENERAAVERFQAVGLVARVELERAEAELASARADQARADAAARAQELALAFALGFERPVTLELAEGLTASSPCEERDLEQLLACAAEGRSELSAARERYQAERERAELAASFVRFLPRVGAGYRSEEGEPSAVATIEVELPLFDSGAAAVQARSAALLGAAAELRRAGQAVAAQVCAAAERLRAARANLEEHARALAARRSALRESAERLFAAGEIDYRDVLLARRDEVVARLALLDAEREAAAARVALDAAVGGAS